MTNLTINNGTDALNFLAAKGGKVNVKIWDANIEKGIYNSLARLGKVEITFCDWTGRRFVVAK